jgi:hypothetical protein
MNLNNISFILYAAMFERKDYGIALWKEWAKKRLSDSPHDPEWQEMEQLKKNEQAENMDLAQNTGTDLEWLLSWVENTEPWVYGPSGAWGMEPLDAHDAVHLDLWTIG